MEIGAERIEKIQSHTGVSAQLARQALEETDDCLLEAVLLLEKKGWAKRTEGGRWSTTWTPPDETEEPEEQAERPTKKRPRLHGRRLVHEVWDAVRSLLRNATGITIDIWRGNDILAGIPLIICVLLFLVAPFVMLPLTVIGLAMRCRYHISGWDHGGEVINRTMDQVTDTVADWTEHMWSEVKQEVEQHRDKRNGKK